MMTTITAKKKAYLWQNASAEKMTVQTACQLLMTHYVAAYNIPHSDH